METDWGIYTLFAFVCCYLAGTVHYLRYRVDKLEEEIKKLKEKHE